MIVVYYGSSSRPSRQAVAWFEEYRMQISQKRIEQITRADLVHILSISENGFLDIIKSAKGSGTRIHKVRNYISILNFDEAVDCLMEHTDVLRVPIIFDKQRLVIGYHPDSIRVFIAKEYRRSKGFQNIL
ncbi:ArsC/Spx/MgsR family protein [Lactococcus petauri]|uniref:ArsC/Spx/MgsR family protein n=1 Tax=Lactococcus petauri TaxID=1940789 RepID=UPI0018A9F4B9|nr:ArsC/Spx/MgsR family protein [Lactococcus petauri]MDC0827085.1 ArsR family transcriptional regulator [Lactococcus petauri]